MSPKSGTVYIKHRKDLPASHSKEESKENKLEEMTKRAGWIIFDISSRPGFITPYRNKITICTNRATITKRSMFSVEEYPMPIENITNARIYTHFLSASLIIETFGIPKPEPLNKLKVNDARLARRYILALIECRKANIDLFSFDLEELRSRLKSLGIVQYTTEKKRYHEL